MLTLCLGTEEEKRRIKGGREGRRACIGRIAIRPSPGWKGTVVKAGRRKQEEGRGGGGGGGSRSKRKGLRPDRETSRLIKRDGRKDGEEGGGGGEERN